MLLPEKWNFSKNCKKKQLENKWSEYGIDASSICIYSSFITLFKDEINFLKLYVKTPWLKHKLLEIFAQCNQAVYYNSLLYHIGFVEFSSCGATADYKAQRPGFNSSCAFFEILYFVLFDKRWLNVFFNIHNSIILSETSWSVRLGTIVLVKIFIFLRFVKAWMKKNLFGTTVWEVICTFVIFFDMR